MPIPVRPEQDHLWGHSHVHLAGLFDHTLFHGTTQEMCIPFRLDHGVASADGLGLDVAPTQAASNGQVLQNTSFDVV